MLTTVYAKKEPTTDSATEYMHQATPSLKPTSQQMDVQVYSDKKATQKLARFPWFYSNKPTKRNKYVTINCCKWRIEWID